MNTSKQMERLTQSIRTLVEMVNELECVEKFDKPALERTMEIGRMFDQTVNSMQVAACNLINNNTIDQMKAQMHEEACSPF